MISTEGIVLTVSEAEFFLNQKGRIILPYTSKGKKRLKSQQIQEDFTKWNSINRNLLNS